MAGYVDSLRVTRERIERSSRATSGAEDNIGHDSNRGADGEGSD